MRNVIKWTVSEYDENGNERTNARGQWRRVAATPALAFTFAEVRRLSALGIGFELRSQTHETIYMVKPMDDGFMTLYVHTPFMPNPAIGSSLLDEGVETTEEDRKEFAKFLKETYG